MICLGKSRNNFSPCPKPAAFTEVNCLNNMSPNAINRETEFLLDQEVERFITDDLSYRPIPYPKVDESKFPVWRVRFSLTADTRQQFGLEINDEIHLGRGKMNLI